MRFGNYLILCTILFFYTQCYGQDKKTKVPPLTETNNIQRLVNNEKGLNNRITYLEKELNRLRQKQSEIRKRIDEQIEHEIKQVNEMKEKLLSDVKLMKSAKEKKIKKYIERSENRIQNLKKLQEELKSNWKDS